MIYAITYDYKQSFMKEWAKDPLIKIEQDGKSTSTDMTYKSSSVPGTSVLFTPKFDNKMLLKMTQEELNQKVEELNYYIDGVQVKSAPLGTNNHPFWMSEHAYFRIENGSEKLNDEYPKDSIILAAMRMDNRFYFVGETSKPPVKSVVRWYVRKIDGGNVEVVDEEKDSLEATRLLLSMDHETKVETAKIMNKRVDFKTDPEVVTAILHRAITTDKNIAFDGTKNQLTKFLELARGSGEDLKIEGLANAAMRFFEKRGQNYYYGEMVLGKNKSAIVSTLKMHPDIILELRKKNEDEK